MQVLIDIPDELAAHLGSNRDELSRRITEDAAVGAYCRDAISKAELQQMLGFATGNELDGLLKSRGIEHGSYSGEDLRNDIALLDVKRLGRV